MDYIRKSITGKKNWVSIDKITESDVELFIANVIVSTLLVVGPGEIILLISKVLEKVKFSTVVKLFDKSRFFFGGITVYNIITCFYF